MLRASFSKGNKRKRWEWYELYRADLARLVGSEAENPALRNAEDYQVAIKALQEAMKI